MERISGSLDFAKTTVTTFSQIVEKAQEKLEGKTEEIMGAGGITFRSDMWVPMFLSLMQTQEFQHLMANMLVQIIKEG
jgi:lipid II:glycine glycyltransferase (peptidoglycan interpeptide bridge formation enzyme)